MVSLSTVKSANDALIKQHSTVTGVFTGATNGIGLATLHSFVKHIPKPVAIVAGRSRRTFQKEFELLKQENPEAQITFLEYDLSLIQNIDTVSEKIGSLCSKHSVDFICASQGYAPIEGRVFTIEGVDKGLALAYYGRMRLIQNLISSGVLKPLAKVVSILVGSKEGAIFENDLPLDKNYSIMNMRGQVSTLTTLSFDVLAEQNPSMTFIHSYPGRVDTGLLARGVQSWFLWCLVYVVERVMMIGAMTVEDSGERTLDLVFGGRFGEGCWSVDFDGSLGRSQWLEKYRGVDGLGGKVWDFNEEMFAKALGRV